MTSTVSSHPSRCACEDCSRIPAAAPAAWENTEGRLPSSRAELLAALDRAYNAGVSAGRIAERNDQQRLRTRGRR